MTLTAGCQQLGAMIAVMGLAPRERVSAEYKLPPGPILILVDDDLDLIQPPVARHALVDELAKHLKEHRITERVTTNEELARLRQSEKEFDRRGTRELGRLANADTVIWLSTKEFFIESDLEIATSPGRFSVELKVVNAQAEEREDVRLWPDGPDGKLITITLDAHEVRACKKPSEVHEKMAAAMADHVAKLFYDYEIQVQ